MSKPKNTNNFWEKSKKNKLKSVTGYLSIFAIALTILVSTAPKARGEEEEDDDLPTSSSSIMPTSSGSAPIISDDEDSDESEED